MKKLMIRGCERRMIKIENTESELFEEAYFVLRQNAQLPRRGGKNAMLREASRIVSEKAAGAASRIGTGRAERMWRIAFFTAGMIMSATVAVLVRLL